MNLFEMKSAISGLEKDRKELSDWIDEKAADPNVAIADLEAKQAKVAEMTKRIEMLKTSAKREEEIQRSRVAVADRTKSGPKDEYIKAKAAFYRAAAKGGDMSKAYEGLGAIPAANADLGSGDKLLPKNLAKELIVEPVEKNPLRAIAHVTNITGYEEPKLGFTIEDADIADVTDKDTANEIVMEGDVVSYGRLKAKVKATVKDTVMHGADVDLVSSIETQLSGALAKREKLYAFQSAASISSNSDTVHAHMSFYNGTVDGSGDVSYAIRAVTGATLYDAIARALGDLADDFAANARVVMKRDDYFAMIQTLTSDSEALFGSKPASILGYPVVFCDRANIPVIGDFQYYGINYDISTVFDVDKDVDKGEYKYVLTAWGDQQIRIKSAFRLALVSAGE